MLEIPPSVYLEANIDIDVMNKSWSCCEQVMNKSRTSHEQVIEPLKFQLPIRSTIITEPYYFFRWWGAGVGGLG